MSHHPAPSVLGQTISNAEYNPEILDPLPRPQVDWEFPMVGHDDWVLHELSYLNKNGQPTLFEAALSYSADTKYLIESKSFKLYLQGMHMERFESKDAFVKRVCKDISNALDGDCEWSDALPISILAGADSVVELDGFSTKIEQFTYDPDILRLAPRAESGTEAHWAYRFHAFRSLCPVTQQPDWATINIKGIGIAPDPEAIYRYLVSFRDHTGFHEQVVCMITQDILETSKTEALAVQGEFYRRGGIAIVPTRIYDPKNQL